MQRTLQPPRQLNARHSVDVPGDLVAAAGETQLVEEPVPAEEAASAVTGAAVGVERVVRGLRELPVLDDLPPEKRVEGVEEAGPVGGPMDLPPYCGDVLLGGRSGCGLGVEEREFACLLPHHLVVSFEVKF